MNLWELPTLDLAKELLGMKLINVDDKGTTSGYIVETEAYLGPEDRAAHSFNNRRTARTEVMYDEAGTIYTYFIYGMHVCFNIVSGPVNKPEAILIRALQPIEGIEKMKKRRVRAKTEIQLTNGPGKLSKAMGFTLGDNGKKMNEENIRIEEGMRFRPNEISSGPRIGIQYAEEAVHYPLWYRMRANYNCWRSSSRLIETCNYQTVYLPIESKVERQKTPSEPIVSLRRGFLSI